MAVQMTRQEYEQKYGVKPVFASTSVLDDEKPAPIQMTRAEYNALYYPEKQSRPDGLGSKLVERGKDILNSGEAERTLAQPLRPELRAVGAVAGAGADVISAVVSPVISAARSFLAEKDITKKVASSKPVGNFLDITNKATDFATGAWKAFEEESPTIAQDLRDIANIASFLPGPKVAGQALTKADDLIAPVTKTIENKGVNNVVNEIAKLENKYVKTRNANTYEKDVDLSRRRIAESNVLADAVDADGVIRTKGRGGAIDQYKKQTIDEFEDIVKLKLDEAKEVMPFADVRKALIKEVGNSGLEGADLVSALKKIDSELAGLAVRTRGSSIIDLGVLHDAKIATTKNIDYFTPPEKRTYRTAIARAYKTLVEKNTKAFDVEEVNNTLSKYYKDIARLERLDGARAEGGKLGKYTASLVGTGIGMAAGSTAGGFGAAIGGVLGGEAAQALKGASMSRTFKGGGKGLAKDPVLVKAKLSIPDKPVKAKASIPKTKEIKEVESQIAKNVADQKKAIKAGDFALVAALKEVYVVLVDELKKLIASVKESAKNPTIGMSIKRTITQEQKLQIAKELEDYDSTPMTVNGRIDLSDTDTEFRLQQLQDKNAGGSFTDTDAIEARTLLERKGVKFDTTPTTLLEEAKKYKSAEEFVKAQETRTGVEVRDKIGTKLQDPYTAKYLPTNNDGTITLYHSTTKEGAEKIKQSGLTGSKTEGGDIYFTTNKNGYGGIGKGKDEVLAFNIDPKKIKFDDVYRGELHLKGNNTDIGGIKPIEIKTKSQLTDIWNKANAGSKIDPLITEARKYKSAEEFVQSRPTKYFHGSPETNTSLKLGDSTGKRFQENQIPGIYMTPDLDTANYYAGKGRVASDVYFDGKMLEVENMQELGKLIGVNKFPKEVMETIPEKLKAMGYDGVLLKQGGEKNEVIVFNESAVKTKSQLTDIWNKANAGSKIDPLITEARKYKSAEEFIADKTVTKGVKESNDAVDTWYDILSGYDKDGVLDTVKRLDLDKKGKAQGKFAPSEGEVNASLILESGETFTIGSNIGDIRPLRGNWKIQTAIEEKKKLIEKGEYPLIYLSNEFTDPGRGAGKTFILDGTHAYWAYKELGYNQVPTITVSGTEKLNDVWKKANPPK